MTDDEREQRDAEEFAALIGGMIALFLSRRKARFDRQRGVWILDGQVVSQRTIRTMIKRMKRIGGMELAALTEKLFADRITLAEWKRDFKKTIRSAHLVAGALATGSVAKAQKASVYRQRIEREEEYLDNFGDQIRRNQAGSEAKAKARAASYMLGAAATFGILEMSERALFGATEAIRIQTAAESCAGCEEYGGEWMPIDDMPEIGSLDCGARCLCYIEYR